MKELYDYQSRISSSSENKSNKSIKNKVRKTSTMIQSRNPESQPYTSQASNATSLVNIIITIY